MIARLRPLLPLAIVVAGLNLVLDDRFHLRILTLTLLWAVAAMSWNLTAKAGPISLGHSAFTGVGAYTFALLYIHLDVSPWLGMLAGMVLAAVAAVIIGLPSFKLEGFYFTLGTIAYPLILMLLVIYFGQGELTIPFQPDRAWFAMQFRDQHTYVWISLGLLALVVVLQAWIDGSRFGYYLRAIRDNEILAQAVGVRTSRWKLAALAISAAIAAAMGVVWVNAILLVVTAEQVFGLLVVIQMLSLVFVGGIASLWGPVLGSVLLVPLALMLDDVVGDQFPGTEALIYGLALVVVALLVPEGLLWRLRRWRAGAATAGGEQQSAQEQPPPADTVTADDDHVTADDLEVERLAPTGAGQGDTGVSNGGEEEPPATEAASTAVLVRADGVRKAFGGLIALRDIDLEIRRGEMVGIIGPNGAGKTTLFNVLTGFLRPDSGTVTFDGQDVTGLSPPDRYVAGISRTFQVPQGFHRMTPYENVLVAAMGAEMDEAHDAAVEALGRVGLAERADAELSSLTTLEVKLLEIARAVASRPVLLLVDEPLAGLNRDERDRLLELLRALGQERGMTVVVIEHSVRSLVKFVERVIALDTGSVLTEGTPGAVISDPRVIESYLGRRWQSDADDSDPASVV